MIRRCTFHDHHIAIEPVSLLLHKHQFELPQTPVTHQITVNRIGLHQQLLHKRAEPGQFIGFDDAGRLHQDSVPGGSGIGIGINAVVTDVKAGLSGEIIDGPAESLLVGLLAGNRKQLILAVKNFIIGVSL